MRLFGTEEISLDVGDSWKKNYNDAPRRPVDFCLDLSDIHMVKDIWQEIAHLA